MPELPEVETIVRCLRRLLVDKSITGVEVHRKDLVKGGRRLTKRILGDRINGVSRRGKYIILELSSGKYLVFHLGMTGRLIYSRSEVPIDRYNVFRLVLGREELRASSVRRFGNIRLFANAEVAEEFLSPLGPDALKISLSDFKSLALRSRQRIKALLLDQRRIAGLGNIYSDEALYRAGIHPTRPAVDLSQEEIKALHRAIRATLRQAIRHSGSSVSDYVRPDGTLGEFQYYHRVYGREGKPCGRCGAGIKRMKLSGRSTYFCPNCQK